MSKMNISFIQNFIQIGLIKSPQSVSNWQQVSKFCTSHAELKTEFFTKNILKLGRIMKDIHAQCCIEAVYKILDRQNSHSDKASLTETVGK